MNVGFQKITKCLRILFRLTLIKEYCLSFIVKEDNFYEIVMSNAFANLDKPLMVEIIRKRLNPGRNMDIKFDKTAGKNEPSRNDLSQQRICE